MSRLKCHTFAGILASEVVSRAEVPQRNARAVSGLLPEPASAGRPRFSPRRETTPSFGVESRGRHLKGIEMRIAATLAVSLILSGCVTGGNDLEDALRLTEAEDDAHCRSLLIQPGELVYAQCRLAMRKTYLNNYNSRKAQIQQQYGFVSTDLDQALRADAFCNYDESVKEAVKPVAEDVAAAVAYGNCAATRDLLLQAFQTATSADGVAFSFAEQPLIVQQNITAVREARLVISGPGVAEVSL
jgi:hypothetical protein